MDAPPPYPGGGGFQMNQNGGGFQMPPAPPPYSEVDPSPSAPGMPAPGGGVGGEVMVVCGGWDGDRALETVEMFSPASAQARGQWTFLPNMMVPRRDHGAAVFGEFLWVVGGWNMDPYYSSTERFHLASQTWSPGPSLSGARGWPGLAVLGDYLYCVGGYDGGDRAVSTVERLHIHGDRWEHVADMNKIRGGCGVIAFQNRIFAIGGYDGRKKKKTVEVYSPEENRWRLAGEMPHSREDLSHSCAVYRDNIVVAGGVGEGDKVLSSCLMFNPVHDSWSPLQAKLLREKRGMSLAVVGGVLYGAGGEDRNDDHLDMVMMLDDNYQMWRQAPSMKNGRAGHGVATFFM